MDSAAERELHQGSVSKSSAGAIKLKPFAVAANAILIWPRSFQTSDASHLGRRRYQPLPPAMFTCPDPTRYTVVCEVATVLLMLMTELSIAVKEGCVEES